MMFRGWRKWLIWVPVVLLLVLLCWWGVRKATMPGPPVITKAMRQQAKRVTIIRDQWGVPHLFGQSDADAAFGLAYAHAEDDFRIIQLVLAASTGRLSLLMLSTRAIGNDYYVAMIKVREQVEALYGKLAPKTRALLEGYALGLNYYAARHPHEVDGRLFPVTGKDLAAGFVHKLPLMFNLPKILGALRGATQKRVGQPVFAASSPARSRASSSQARMAQLHSHSPFAGAGSNAHAVHRSRFRDDVTRININSHQPWEGPVAWYEAHVHSQEGWNMTGSLFPGSPVILHGHNDHLGWAMTVNKPDVADVYKLVMHPTKPLTYKLDGQWQKLRTWKANIAVDTGLFNYPFKMDVYHSVHGPVMKTSHGYYAIRYVGAKKGIFAVEQWYQMNKAKDLASWKAAMKIHAIPMFNLVYADRDNVLYVYNAILPVRKPGFDYHSILPGDRSDLIWKASLPWERLPMVHNPPAGFVQNCNATPFHATVGKGNPLPAAYQRESGIEQKNNNRSIRSLALLSSKSRLTHQDFLAMKFDLTYAKDSPMIKTYLAPLLSAKFKPTSALEKQGVALLRRWNRKTTATNPSAALFLLTYHAHRRSGLGGLAKARDAIAGFRQALHFLYKHYGRLDVPLGEIQRLRRGQVDLPVSGGPDILRAVHSRLKGDKLVGVQGDSYIMIAEFTKGGVRSYSRHQYGNVNRKQSKHYADQASDFVKHKLKPVVRDEAKLRKTATAIYHPGQEH